jgi:hypothetical protein
MFIFFFIAKLVYLDESRMRKKHIFLIFALHLLLTFRESSSQEGLTYSVSDELNQSAEPFLNTPDLINKTPSVDLKKKLDNLSISTETVLTSSSSSSVASQQTQQQSTTASPTQSSTTTSTTSSSETVTETSSEQAVSEPPVLPPSQDIKIEQVELEEKVHVEEKEAYSNIQSIQINFEKDIDRNVSR